MNGRTQVKKGPTRRNGDLSFRPVQARILQRKCACGTHTVAGGDCASCKKEEASSQLQRSATRAGRVNEVPPIVHEGLRSSGRPLDTDTRSFFEPRFHYDFSRVRVHTDAKAGSSNPMASAIRPGLNSSEQFEPDAPRPIKRSFKLIVSNPGDPMELEADRMADRVVGSGLARDATLAHAPTSIAQREAEIDGTNDSMSEEAAEEDSESEAGPEISDEAQLIGDESGRPKLAPEASTRPEKHSISIPDLPGTSLQPGVRTFMESRFGRDFSHVRVHTDDAAARSAQDLWAHAYTVGRDIYFNEGRYNPNSLEGRRLLAHELTHVVQQTGGAPLAVQRAPDKPSRRPKGPRDAPSGTGQRRRRSGSAAKPKCATGECDGACAAPVEKLIRHPSCGNETCANGSAASSSNFIRHLDVDLATQMVTADLGTTTTTISTRSLLSSPNPGATPKGPFKIGLKCGPCHTNMHAHGMGWFTGFRDLEFGFHNSQRVAKGVHSLGCVRVPCADAKWVHDNTESGVTTVCVHTGDHCKPKAPKAKGKDKGKSKGKAPKKASSGGGTGGPSVPSPAPNKPPLVSEAEPADMEEPEEELT